MVVMAYASNQSPATKIGDLVLKIRGTDRDGQVLRLKSAKCRIGSAPTCDLRLRSSQVAPLHCMIVRGEGGTVVRSWSRDTRLNGEAFDDARLQVGDRLAIGPIEFEVVEMGTQAICGAPSQQADRSRDAGETDRRRLEAQYTEIEARVAEMTAMSDQFSRRESALDARAAELAAESRAFELARQQWDARRASDESRQAELLRQTQQGQAALDAREAEIAQSQRVAAAEQARRFAEIETRSAEVDRLAAETTAYGDALSRRQSEFERRAAELEGTITQQRSEATAAAADAQQRLAACQAEIEGLNAELQAERSHVGQAQGAWEADRTGLEARCKELETQLAEATSKNNELGHYQRELEARSAALEDLRRQMEGTEAQQRAEATAAAADAEQQLAACRAQIEGLHAELEAERSRLGQSQNAWEANTIQLEAKCRDFETLVAEVTAKNVELNQRAGDLESKATELDDLRNHDQERLAAGQAEIEGLHAALEAERSRVGQSQDAWECDRLHMEAKCRELETQAADRSDHLEAQRRELDAQTQSFALQRQQWDAQRASDETEHAELLKQTQELRASLEAGQAALAQERLRWNEQRAAAEAEHADAAQQTLQLAEIEIRAAEVERLAAEAADRSNQLDRREANVDQRIDELKAGRAELEELRAELQTEREEFQGQVRRWEQDRESERETQATAIQESLPSPVTAPTESPSRSDDSPSIDMPKAGSLAGEAHEEDSINEYMTRLLQRVRGGDSQAEYSPAAEKRPEPQPVAEVSLPYVETLKQTVSEAVPSPIKEMSEIAPRAAAPETLLDLGAMRSLANLSAKHALGAHSQRIIGKACRMKLLMMVLAIVSGSFLFQMYSLFHLGVAVLYGAVGALLAATVWGIHFVILLVRLKSTRRSRAPQSELAAAPAASDATHEEVVSVAEH